ncbi:MAG: AbrB/MazE/SpoVT family DNA-binding domain-containing protein [Gemmatimonadetes bacterium]|nr:AbrB/MazE/SpoVT family DNA-binding domain-containing protein [Gemmatimonadota bacterium]MYB71629.1 AbrB/MazE/SpoVT family DNA-binding domain-containing protein [Gemmatimonadota bacterium]
MIESSITKKGQTTLPKSVRETLGLKAGDRVRYVISDGEVRMLPSSTTAPPSLRKKWNRLQPMGLVRREQK